MKTGIKTLLFVLMLIGTGFSSQTLAATATGKAPPDVKAAATMPAGTEKSAASIKNDRGNDDKVSINTGSAEELARVMNGVGLKKAQAIISYREEFGPFKSLDDLRQVPGMGGALVERNLSHLML